MTLRDVLDWTCIIAHNEDTGVLEAALRDEGLQPETQRDTPNGDQRCSNIVRCLMNHQVAWRRAAALPGLSLIVEADFVPCMGFGNFPLPIPESEMMHSCAWLYLCAGRFNRRVEAEVFLGSSISTVAYIVSPAAASCLDQFAAQTLESINLHAWHGFDSHISAFLEKSGIRMFLPLRNYGEHGGYINPEHRQDGRRFWPHRAECLMGPLHFLPSYASGSHCRFVGIRSLHKLKAFAKLLAGRTVTSRALKTLSSTQERAGLLLAGFRRLLSPW